MDTVNIKIDVTTTQGYKLVRELYGKKGVEIENTDLARAEKSSLDSAEREVFGSSQNTIKQEATGTTYSVKEVFDELKDSLKKHYGADK